ncbi:MAG: putative rane protein [Acidimicrobiaceae bacterium]|nr:putative rane protein [Acidimicrobiaceae bacterium]
MDDQAQRDNEGSGTNGAARGANVNHTIGVVRHHLDQLEHLLGSEGRSVEARLGPAWQRAHAGDHRLPVSAVVALAIALQVLLPNRFSINPIWLLPALEGALGIGLAAANPHRIDRSSRALRASSLLLIALISLANGWSALLLVHGLVVGRAGLGASTLLFTGGEIYLTNIIVFGLWYWEFDRGGPVARAQAQRRYPDFLFPQMSNPELAPPDWTTHFFDYLWLSYTNATAFSPTDVMPFSRWAKQLMMLQSAISLVTIALVVARAVNILK